MLNWYLIHTKARSEDPVARRFLEKGMEVLNPRYRTRKLIRRRPREVSLSLFPGYVFLRFDDTRDYRMVKYTRGVRDVVGFGEGPSVVPEVIIESIRARMTGDGIVALEPCRFRPGDEVIIRGGNLEGFSAVFERELGGMERVSILLKSALSARVVIDGALLTRA